MEFLAVNKAKDHLAELSVIHSRGDFTTCFAPRSSTGLALCHGLKKHAQPFPLAAGTAAVCSLTAQFLQNFQVRSWGVITSV